MKTETITQPSPSSILNTLHHGSHICQFYKTKEDLIDILVPYFKAGLANNESCVWITSEPLGAEEARAALKKAVPDLDDYINKGQLEIIDYRQWYTKRGGFEAARVLDDWITKEKKALNKGFKGLRVTGNTSWLEPKDWQNFIKYENTIHNIIHQHQMTILCSYCLDNCTPSDIVDVTSTHRSTIIKQESKWQIIEDTEYKKADNILKASEAKYRSLFGNMIEGFAYCKMLFDKNNKPIDFIYLEVNESFERLTTLKRKDIIGKKVTEAIPGIKNAHPELFDIYGQVALTGQGTQFEINFQPLNRWLAISVYSPQKGYFIAVFTNITEYKQAEKELETSLSLLRATVESTTDGILVVNPDGKWTSFNKKFIDMWRIPNEIVESRDDNEALEFVLSQLKDPEVFIAKVKELYNKPNKDSFDTFEFKDGRFFERYSQPQRINKDIVGRVWSFRDITERKKTEEERERLLRIFEVSKESLHINALDTTIIYANEACYNLFGYNPGELIGKPVSIFNAEASSKKIVKQVIDAIAEKGSWEGEIHNKKKDGTEFMSYATIAGHKGKDGKIINYISTQHDITERKENEQRIEKQGQALLQKNTALKELLEQISLEKKEITDRITTNLEKLLIPKLRRLKNKLDGTDIRQIKSIETSIKNIASEFGSKLTDKRRSLSPREIEVCDLITEGLKNKAMARELNLSIKTIESIRKIIRNKFKISNKQINLRAYLKSL